MAEKEIERQTALSESEQRSQLVQLWLHVQENPWQYVGGAAFLLFCGLAGALYSVSQEISGRDLTTQYAEAMMTEEPALRVAALENIAEASGKWAPEVVYMAAEAAIRAEEYDKARELFQHVLDNYSDWDRAAEAADGLAYIKENSGDLEGALAGYQEILTKWDSSFTGLRTLYKIARVQEAQGNLPAAIESYQSQVNAWPESEIANKSERELQRLKRAHPELFPEEVTEEAPPVAEDAPAEAAAPAAEAAATAVEAAPEAEAAATAVEAAPEAEAAATAVESAPEDEAAVPAVEAAPEAEAAPAVEAPSAVDEAPATEAAIADDAAPEADEAPVHEAPVAAESTPDEAAEAN